MPGGNTPVLAFCIMWTNEWWILNNSHLNYYIFKKCTDGVQRASELGTNEGMEESLNELLPVIHRDN